MKRITHPAPIWAVVPVKRLDRAKSRLAGVLDVEQRAILAAAMLRDVLETIAASSQVAGTIVVTADPAAASLARLCGAEPLRDRRGDGLDDAIRQGTGRARSNGARGVLVLPGDVPLIDTGEIGEICAALARTGSAIVPATRDGGTNALAAAPPDHLRPSFGEGSFQRHLAAMAAAGLSPSVLRLAGTGHDIDVAGDLDLPGQRPDSARWTRQCLADFGRLSPCEAPRRLEKVSS